jgi:hypothetical protein
MLHARVGDDPTVHAFGQTTEIVSALTGGSTGDAGRRLLGAPKCGGAFGALVLDAGPVTCAACLRASANERLLSAAEAVLRDGPDEWAEARLAAIGKGDDPWCARWRALREAVEAARKESRL